MNPKEPLDRRDFLKKASAAGLGAFAASRGAGPLFAFEGSPAEKMSVGVMGLNGRGKVPASAIEIPTLGVDLVRSVVADLSGSPVGEPMPVVVDDVVAIRSARRRPLPQLVVEICRHGNDLALPYPRPRIRIPGAGEVRLADHSFANRV